MSDCSQAEEASGDWATSLDNWKLFSLAHVRLIKHVV